MNFFRPPLTSFIKTLADPQLESEQFMIGNESITSKKDVIRQLQEQILHFKEAHNFTLSEMEVIRQFESLLESKHKRRAIDIHFQSQITDMTRKRKSELFRMKRAKKRATIKQEIDFEFWVNSYQMRRFKQQKKLLDNMFSAIVTISVLRQEEH